MGIPASRTAQATRAPRRAHRGTELVLEPKLGAEHGMEMGQKFKAHWADHRFYPLVN